MEIQDHDLLRFGAASLGILYRTFRGKGLLGISNMADETTTLFQNVGRHVTSGAALHVTD
jgi:hypothetical protein